MWIEIEVSNSNSHFKTGWNLHVNNIYYMFPCTYAKEIKGYKSLVS